MNSRKIETNNKYLQVTIVAQSKTVVFRVSHNEDLSEFRGRFFMIFMKDFDEEKNILSIDHVQTNAPVIREKLTEFISRYRMELPMVNKLNDYFKLLKEGELFMIFPYEKLSTMEQFKATKYLQSLEVGEDYEKIFNKSIENFGELFNHYNISIFDEDHRGWIGEPDKSKRVCRFCNNLREKISFKSAAHAISESLGNKHLFLNEECDECNSFFGMSIEQDLTAFLKIYLSFTGIKGKNGNAKTKGKNFKLSNEGQLLIELSEPIKYNHPFTTTLRLDSNFEITEQNIYRCLCKFALGLIKNEYLPYYTKTIDWINCTKSFNELPKVAYRIEPDQLYPHPIMFIYQRKTENDQLPHLVAELRVSIVKLVFIVPTFNEEGIDYAIEENYSKYWAMFKHLSSLDEWTFLDFTNDVKKNLIYNLNFEIGDSTKFSGNNKIGNLDT